MANVARDIRAEAIAASVTRELSRSTKLIDKFHLPNPAKFSARREGELISRRVTNFFIVHTKLFRRTSFRKQDFCQMDQSSPVLILFSVDLRFLSGVGNYFVS